MSTLLEFWILWSRRRGRKTLGKVLLPEATYKWWLPEMPRRINALSAFYASSDISNKGKSAIHFECKYVNWRSRKRATAKFAHIFLLIFSADIFLLQCNISCVLDKNAWSVFRSVIQLIHNDYKTWLLKNKSYKY